MLTQKDIVAINSALDSGQIVNQGSLDYALSVTYRNKNWLRCAAVLTRAILIDHVFEDGNKRTVAAIIMAYFEMNSIGYCPDKINKLIVLMLKKNIVDIKKIERLISNARE
ncbi:MAG: hypothetical protein Q7K43_00830 [Candidatus Woesearchaeota archaeon]|nr:hypothetical protein [Candidatus Woesearchaeota archaeon]